MFILKQDNNSFFYVNKKVNESFKGAYLWEKEVQGVKLEIAHSVSEISTMRFVFIV